MIKQVAISKILIALLNDFLNYSCLKKIDSPLEGKRTVGHVLKNKPLKNSLYTSSRYSSKIFIKNKNNMFLREDF